IIAIAVGALFMDPAIWADYWERVTRTDFKGAAELLLEGALSGDALAQCNLGQMIVGKLINSLDIGISIETIINWLQNQSVCGNGMASFAIAQGYINNVFGEGNAHRRSAARRYLELAASQGVSLSTLLGMSADVEKYCDSVIDRSD